MRTLPGFLCALVLALTLLPGCRPVREDRRINFSADGRNVAFQHGSEGVFVAGSQGEALKKIFQPDKDTLAISSPLYSPTDRRLIFTTARGLQPDGQPAPRSLDPAGALHTQRPAVYTCWLRSAAGDTPPQPLFTAECDHVGYVAANLAVRWHPGGDRVLFLARTTNHQHALFEFDLASKAKRQVFPHSAGALIFDWAPDGQHLVCVLGKPRSHPQTAGIWVGKPGDDNWWHVPQSSALAQGGLPSLIEQLRATRPAWTADSRRFAFVSFRQPDTHLLRTADLALRTVQTVALAAEPFRDLHWAPDGLRLGVVKGRELGSLHIVRDGVLGPAVNARPVRRFAGWHATGSHLSYIVPDRILHQDERSRAFLFVPDPLARDAVFLAPGDAAAPGQEVLSGMRVTFPQWSPSEPRLSLWATFAPTQRSWLAALLGSALQPGDPAAVLDLTTLDLGWMAVNAHEKAQVGHYHLLRRHYAEAWRWYEQAHRDQPAGDFTFFEFYCLTKLARPADAQARLDRFRKEYRPAFATANLPPLVQTLALGGRTTQQWLADLSDPPTLSGQLLRDLYEAEVFLSLDAAADGESFFRQELQAAKSDEETLSHTVVLGQFLLLRQKPRAFAELAADRLLPLLVKMWDPAAPKKLESTIDLPALQQLVLMTAGAAALLPLADPDFLKTIPDDVLRKCVPNLSTLAGKALDSYTGSGANLVLLAVARKLDLEKERQQAAAALKRHDTDIDEKNFDERIREAFVQIRKVLRELTAAR
jgi:hypothetical protein